MTEQYIGWALVLGLVVGGALVWYAVGRLPHSGEQTTDAERQAEAEWISEQIAAHEGNAPAELVAEVLDLHGRYLDREELEGV
jgi:hypothetical protein